MRKKVALLGCGNLGRIIVKGIMERLCGEYVLAAVCVRSDASAEALRGALGCRVCTSLEEMLAERPDIVIEAAAGGALKEAAIPILRSGADLIVLSVGAFADPVWYEEVAKCAGDCGRKVHLAAGAIGGLDVMRAVRLDGALDATIINRKHPRSLPPEYADRAGQEIFSGNAAEAIRLFPKNVNVAVATALATVGVNNTKVRIISDPDARRNVHTIRLNGDFGEATVEIASEPSKENPASSQLAAYSVLSKLEELAAPITFC